MEELPHQEREHQLHHLPAGSISTAYLSGQSPTAWFDLRGYYFQTLCSDDWQKQQPVVLPVLDYDKRVHKPSFLGGELEFNVNVTYLTRDTAAFKQIPTQTTYLINVRRRRTVLAL